MRTLLNVFAVLSLFGGMALGLYGFFTQTDILGSPTLGVISGAAAFIVGLAGFAIFGGIAEVLKKLEALEVKK